jgi:hypothetical protein
VNARLFTGTLEGHTGKFVTEEVGLNLQTQIDLLLEGLQMAAQASTTEEARRMAQDVLDGHQRSLAIMGSSH